VCGRYAFYSPHEAVEDVFGPWVPGAELPPPRWNIAPTTRVAVVRGRPDGQRELVLVRWGLIPSWAKDRSIGARLINARAESLADKPAFRTAYRRRRCLVLADGYYEWQVTSGAKQPYYVQASDLRPFGMAGLWEAWTDPVSHETLETCVIVTTEASAAIRAIHGRMPVIVPKSQHGAWLDLAQQSDALAAVVAGEAAPLSAHPVSRQVNSPAQDGPELIVPYAKPA
jgi:putative SOS response-associated peptidase YedK